MEVLAEKCVMRCETAKAGTDQATGQTDDRIAATQQRINASSALAFRE
jgi:hypothetical protein